MTNAVKAEPAVNLILDFTRFLLSPYKKLMIMITGHHFSDRVVCRISQKVIFKNHPRKKVVLYCEAKNPRLLVVYYFITLLKQ